MERSEIKLEIPETLMTDEIILDSAGNNLTDSPFFRTNHEGAIDLKQECLINNSVNCVVHNEIQNEKMGNSLIEPSLRTISNLVVIAPQDDNFSKCELFETNRKRPYSPGNQKDINQHPIIPAVKQEMMEFIIKHEINEDVSMEESDDKEVQGEIQNYKKHIKLEENINCLWLDNLNEAGKMAQPVMKNEMSEERHQEDLVKSERIDRDVSDDQTSKPTFSGSVCKRRLHLGTRPVASCDYDKSCSLSSGEELDKKEKNVHGSQTVHHLHSDHSDAQSYVDSPENHSLIHHQSKKSFKCPDCDKEFQKVRYLKKHAVVHANIKPMICPVSAFSKHQSLHNSEKALLHARERPFACEICNKSFAHATSFHNHMITHQNVKLFSCPDCDKVFPNESSLKMHLLKHSSERPHLCTICNKTFKYLQKHQRTHTEEKAHACITCNKTFKTKTSLQQHQRTHTGKKPYACTTCDKSFVALQGLQCHKLTHTGAKPYGCTMCNKSFRQQGTLKVHQRTHTGETI